MARSQTAKTSFFGSFFAGSTEVALPRLVLVVAIFFLSVFGLVVVFSASSVEAMNEDLPSSFYVVRQLIFMVVGTLICFAILIFAPYDIWHTRLLDFFWIGTIVLMLMTAAVGDAALGAQRWLTIGGITGQPSEFAKAAFVLMAARIMYNARYEKMDTNSFLIQIGLLIVLPLAVLYVTQSDLGTTLICLVGILAVVYLSGIPVRTMLLLTLALGLFAVAAVLFRGYRSDRLTNLLNPEDDYYGSGYQLVRSFYAFGEGGLFGVGPGNSTEKYLYLPEAETDFIFAIVGEEYGLIGALLVVAAFFAILWAGLSIAKGAPDLFGTLVAGGCTVTLVFQAFLNMACVTGVLPTTGKPLPFMSAGGSAIVGAFILIGIILSVSLAQDGKSPMYERRRNDLKVVRASGQSHRKKGKK